MKKVFTFIMMLALNCSPQVVYAENEKVVAQTQETKITCSIDRLFIESYAVNGFIYLPIDRLTDYGFNLNVNAENIELKRNEIVYFDGCYDEVDTGSNLPVYENPTPVIIDGKTANTYLIKDRIAIQADELQVFGKVTWNEHKQRVAISIIEDELINAFENAEDLVTDSRSGSGIFLRGQQDENGVWNGIVKYGNFGDKIMYLGYMKDGKYEGVVLGNREHEPYLAALSELKTVRNGVRNGYCWYELGYNNKPPIPQTIKNASGMYENDVLKKGEYTIYTDDYMNTATFEVKDFKEQIICSKQVYYNCEKSLSKVFYNGELINFDVAPIMENERTLIPLRGLFEKMGAVVEWDNETQTATVTRDGMVLSVKIDHYKININDSYKYMDTPARLVENRTMIPLRFLSEELGYDVIWNDKDNSIRIKNCRERSLVPFHSFFILF